MAQRKAIDEDIRMLQYFWEEKEDIERYCDFEDIKEDLAENYPEILKCWNDYKITKKLLGIVLTNVELK